MAREEGRSSPASPRPTEGGADLGGSGPRLKAFGRWAVCLAPLPRLACPAAGTGLAPSPFSLCPMSGRASSVTGLHALEDFLGGCDLCSLFLWTELRWEVCGSRGGGKVSSHLPLNKAR